MLDSAEDFKDLDWYQNQITHIETQQSFEGEFTSPDSILTSHVADSFPYEELYTHQAEALQEIQSGKDVCIETSTASGKTMIYALNFANEYYTADSENKPTGLLIYPTKALAQDQYNELSELYQETLGLDISIGVYDGDTTKEEKQSIREDSDLILTNFQGLNYYLPYHSSWEEFFSSLSCVVIDEAHLYTGLMGIHVAMIIRRLRRIVENVYTSHPQFILTTATINNPYQHTQKLIGRDSISVVDSDT